MCETCGCQGSIISLAASDTSTDTPASEPTPQPFAERFSDDLQQIIGALVGSNRKPPRRFKSFLNGSWLGHPLHPVLTDVVIGAWLLAVVFDITWLISSTSFAWAARGAETGVIIGVLGALAAATTGLTDWSDTYGAERRVGLNHAIFNVSALILYIVSLILRLTQPTGESIVGAIFGFAGFLLVSYAAYLGGDMVYTKGTNVNHTAWEGGSDAFEAVMPFEQAEEGRLYRVVAAGVPVVLLRRASEVFAMSATCTHAGGPLDEGMLEGDVVQCPWHGSRFCIRDGRVESGPATTHEPHYETRVNNGQIEVRRAQ